LLLAAAVRSFAHMPLGISDRNTLLLILAGRGWFQSNLTDHFIKVIASAACSFVLRFYICVLQ